MRSLESIVAQSILERHGLSEGSDANSASGYTSRSRWVSLVRAHVHGPWGQISERFKFPKALEAPGCQLLGWGDVRGTTVVLQWHYTMLF